MLVSTVVLASFGLGTGASVTTAWGKGCEPFTLSLECPELLIVSGFRYQHSLTVAPVKFLTLPLGSVRPSGWLRDQVSMFLLFCHMREATALSRSWTSKPMVLLGICMNSMTCMSLVASFLDKNISKYILQSQRY
jgi:hypothetical protein